MIRMSSYHVAIAAEAAAASMFARCGCDVLVQYGANQPEYDLAVSRQGRLLQVSVKGSQDGGWGLTQSLLKNANYHGAIDDWLSKHSARTAFCFVQFKATGLTDMPRLYLATPTEIATRLHESAGGRGETILYERKEWTAKLKRPVDEISAWRFTSDRLDTIFSVVRSNAA